MERQDVYQGASSSESIAATFKIAGNTVAQGTAEMSSTTITVGPVDVRGLSVTSGDEAGRNFLKMPVEITEVPLHKLVQHVLDTDEYKYHVVKPSCVNMLREPHALEPDTTISTGTELLPCTDAAVVNRELSAQVCYEFINTMMREVFYKGRTTRVISFESVNRKFEQLKFASLI